MSDSEKQGAAQAVGQVAQDSKEAVKQTAQETVATAKQAAQDISTQVQQQAGDVIEQTAEQLGDTAVQVKQQATSAFAGQRDKAVSGLSGLADALRQTAKSLTEAVDAQDSQIPAGIAPLVDEAAERLSKSADFLKDKDITGLLSEAQQLARKQPALFMGGMFAVGLVGARLLKGTMGDDGEGPRASYVDSSGDAGSSGGSGQGLLDQAKQAVGGAVDAAKQMAGSGETGSRGSGDDSGSGSGENWFATESQSGSGSSVSSATDGMSTSGAVPTGAAGSSWQPGETLTNQSAGDYVSPSGSSIFDEVPAEPKTGTMTGGSIAGGVTASGGTAS